VTVDVSDGRQGRQRRHLRLLAVLAVGMFGFGFALVPLYGLFCEVTGVQRGGRRADPRVWEGAKGLEWELPSPPPFHSWTTAPQVR
jgi:cytochrome c oxidase subunit 1